MTQVHICESGRRADKNEGSGEGRKQGERRKERKEQEQGKPDCMEGGGGTGKRKEEPGRVRERRWGRSDGRVSQAPTPTPRVTPEASNPTLASSTRGVSEVGAGT